MKLRLKYTIIAAAALLSTCAARGQAMPAAGPGSHRLEIGGAIDGQYTSSVTSQIFAATNGALEPHQATTDSAGGLFTVRERLLNWASVEANYGYTRFSERFFLRNSNVFLDTSMHEATGAVVLQRHLRRMSPYIGIGGGGLSFVRSNRYTNQWRDAGLFDIGADMQTKSQLGFRVGARELLYRAPNFYNAGLSSSRWAGTSEPYVGVYLKF